MTIHYWEERRQDPICDTIPPPWVQKVHLGAICRIKQALGRTGLDAGQHHTHGQADLGRFKTGKGGTLECTLRGGQNLPGEPLNKKSRKNVGLKLRVGRAWSWESKGKRETVAKFRRLCVGGKGTHAKPISAVALGMHDAETEKKFIRAMLQGQYVIYPQHSEKFAKGLKTI